MPILIWLLMLQLDSTTAASFFKFFESLNAYETEFTQITESPFLETTRAKGSLSVQQPGKFKMVYVEGEEKLVVSDGELCREVDYLAETHSDTQVEEIRNEPLIRALVFGEDLRQHFLVDRIKTEDGTETFRLRPREDDSYHLEMRFQENWVPLSIEYISSEGEKTRFLFSAFSKEVSFPEGYFSIPQLPFSD